jgi:hypothetical protein
VPPPSVRTAALTLACLVVAGVAAAVERRIAITADTPATEVNRYFSPLAHGPTQKFYVLPESRIVVIVATVDGKAEASATIHLFPADVAAEGIAKWINNQHSDALHPDVPLPIRSVAVPPTHFHATVGRPLDHETGQQGDEYDRVRVDFTIDAFKDGDLSVEPSRGSLDAFIRTKEPTAREPRASRGHLHRPRVS